MKGALCGNHLHLQRQFGSFRTSERVSENPRPGPHPARTQFLIEPEDFEHVWSGNRRCTKRAKLNRKVTWADTITAIAVRIRRQNENRNQEHCSRKSSHECLEQVYRQSSGVPNKYG